MGTKYKLRRNPKLGCILEFNFFFLHLTFFCGPLINWWFLLFYCQNWLGNLEHQVHQGTEWQIDGPMNGFTRILIVFMPFYQFHDVFAHFLPKSTKKVRALWTDWRTHGPTNRQTHRDAEGIWKPNFPFLNKLFYFSRLEMTSNWKCCTILTFLFH